MRLAAGLVVGLFFSSASSAPTVPPPELGIVADSSGMALVFDTDPASVLRALSLGPGGTAGDCVISPDGRRGFVTDFHGHVWVIDSTSVPPQLAPGTNPIAISNPGEDVAATADGRFLVVCDGALNVPVSVVDVASRAEIGTFSLGTSCNAVDVCTNGSVLVASTDAGRVRRLVIDSMGHLSDTGEQLFVPDSNNVYCSPNGSSGVSVGRDGYLRSFRIPGLMPVSVRHLSGVVGRSGAMANDGTRFYGRAFDTVDAFDFDQATGELGGAPSFTVGAGPSLPYYGVDQLSLDLAGTKLYVPEAHRLAVFDAATGAALPAFPIPDLQASGGICFGPQPATSCVVAACDDGNPCTDDACDEAGCIHVANDSHRCGGPDTCLATHVCSAGACVSTGPGDCNGLCPPGFIVGDGTCIKTYRIDVTRLDNLDDACDVSGVDRFNCEGQSYGFHWTDEAGGGVAGVETVGLEFISGLSCDDSVRELRLNGQTVNSFYPSLGCSCNPPHTTINLPYSFPTSYERNGVNTVSIVPLGPCEGLSAGPALEGLFARVTVTYSRLDPNCATGVCNATSGECEYVVVHCDDGNPCTADTCDAEGQCVHDFLPEYSACNDDNVCNGYEYCHAGGDCYADSPYFCYSDGNPCTIDYCDPVTGCTYEPLVCPEDGNPCTTATCDPYSGGCGFLDNDDPCSDANPCTSPDQCGGGTCHGGPPIAGPCDDGDLCTTGDACEGGTCHVGTPIECAGLDQCHTAGACDPASGACSNPVKPDGTTCNDSDLCTAGETCVAGACMPASSGLNEPNPRTNGYYKRLCHGPHSGDELTDADAACVASVAHTFAGLTTVFDICAELTPSDSNNDACDRADDDLMVLALNICRGRVCSAQSIDSQCGDNASVGESLAESDAILDDASRDTSTCAHAKCLDEEINTGRALELNSLVVGREGSSIRLDWLPPYLDDGTGHPSKYHVWRRTQGSLAPFVKIGITTDPTYLDTAAAIGAYEYEVTAVMN